MTPTLITIIYLVGVVVAYVVGCVLAYVSLRWDFRGAFNEWTIGDRIFCLTVSIFSWLNFIHISMYISSRFFGSKSWLFKFFNKPAKW